MHLYGYRKTGVISKKSKKWNKKKKHAIKTSNKKIDIFNSCSYELCKLLIFIEVVCQFWFDVWR